MTRGSTGGCHKTAAVGVGTTVEVGVGMGSGSGVSGEPPQQADAAAGTSISTAPKPRRRTLSVTVMVTLYQPRQTQSPFFRAFTGCTPVYGARHSAQGRYLRSRLEVMRGLTIAEHQCYDSPVQYSPFQGRLLDQPRSPIQPTCCEMLFVTGRPVGFERYSYDNPALGQIRKRQNA